MDSSQNHRKILIIDDESDICLLLAALLKKRNFEVSFANSLTEGFNKLATFRPFLLFLDINLPDGSGLDAINEIKQTYPLLKIIMISAYDSPQKCTAAREKGIDLFISKPFNKEIIYDALNKMGLDKE